MRGSQDQPHFNSRSALITLFIISVVLAVGFRVYEALMDVSPSELRAAYNNTTTVCGFGCGTTGADLFGFLGVSVIVLVLSVVMVHLVSLRKPKSHTDGVESAKTLYVEGEIDILELEERLDNEIDEDDLEP